MLLIGMCINLTKKPMKPIMQKPIAVAIAIFWNSVKKSYHFIKYKNCIIIILNSKECQTKGAQIVVIDYQPSLQD